MTHDEYLKRREELIKIRDDSATSFDKTILALTTGGLGLSIAFIDKIGTPYNLYTVVLISLTWILLFGVAFSTVLSFYFAQKNMDDKLSLLNKDYKKYGERDFREKDSHFKKYVYCCNNSALILFILGAFTFVAYVIIIQTHYYNNLSERKMTKKTISREEVQKGLTEPPAPVTKPGSGKTEPTPPVRKPPENPPK